MNVSDASAETVAALSPVALFVSSMQRITSPSVGPGPLTIAYGALAVLAYAMLRRVLRREATTVRGKLQAMALT